MPRSLLTLITAALALTAAAAHAQSLADQWKMGLSGVRLTAYSGSVTSSNSTLTVIDFCHNGRYSYYKEGSWSVAGTAGGASTNAIRGPWDVRQNGYQVLLVYRTDQGEAGSFPMYLQNNGRVNIGGTAFAAERGRAGC